MSDILDRLLAKDATLWPDGNVGTTRLGWVDIAERMLAEADDLQSWANSVDAPTVVLLGMGGSSLGPEVLRSIKGSDRLIVLDTTDPATIADVSDITDAFYLVSSKSGGTLEVQSLLSHFRTIVSDGSRYAAITDPGTVLESQAREYGFARTFSNDANIGGRYSVLSYFGLVPAALLGYDIRELLEGTRSVQGDDAVGLGMSMARAALEGKDKVSILCQPEHLAFGLWVEQLIAESTGKHDKGCVPVPSATQESGPDRFHAEVHIETPSDLGREFLHWEIATAVAGHVLKIDPFDEPNVAESKANSAKVLSSLPIPDPHDEVTVAPAGVVDWLQAQVSDGDYVSIQAYLPYASDDRIDALATEKVRRRLSDALGTTAVTVGFGPRFLHSTGQLHKGGPNKIIAVQVMATAPTAEVDIPNQPYDFSTLIAAQAIGDFGSLRSHERRCVRTFADSIEELS